MSGFSSIGKRLLRFEDRRFLTGQGAYLDDIVAPRCLHAHFLRSPHAHARIRAIDAREAARLPGVRGVYLGADLAAMAKPLRMAPPIEGLKPTEIAPLPVDKVRFQGDPVAVILADDRYIAEDAAELIAVDYEPLPAVTSFAEALSPGAPKVDDTLDDNLVAHQSFTTPGCARVFAEARRIVTRRFVQNRVTHAPIETRGCLAIWDEGRQYLTFHVGNQAPHPYRTQLAARLGLSESQVTVIAPDIGGAFGQKIALYREELACAALARATRRPVRWREDRMENLAAASHAREDACVTRAAIDAQGRILALDVVIEEDFGAYCFFPGNYLARVVALMTPGPYRIRDYAYDVRVALTNKCGAGPMRAPMSMTSWIMEGTIDAIAAELDADPADIRRLNMIEARELPYVTVTDQRLEDITPRETLEGALAHLDYAAARTRQRADRARGILRGLGICVVVESTTYGSAFYKSAGIPGSGHETAVVKVEPSGAVNAAVGLMASGQGYETALAQAVAEGLGVDPATVRLQIGNTDVAPYGMGSRGARGATAGGGVLYLASQALGEKIRTIAARELGLNDIGELRLAAGRIERRLAGAWEATRLSLTDVARIAYLDPLRLPPGLEPGLEVHKAYEPPAMTFSNATHVCEVVVDARSGRIAIERYIVAEDCGTPLNPMLVEGQQIGAVAMGLSGCLSEHVVYDRDGQNLSTTFADYHLATAVEIPHIEIVPMHTPNRSTPAGVKGMSEGGVMGAIGALANAVDDALRPLGIRAEALPLTPIALRRLIRTATRRSAP